MSKLNVFISAMDDPCGISQRTWYVTIYDCDGNVLQHCGKKYVVLPARCGHLEVEVPPGCYYIKAVWNYHIVKPGVYRVNHFTDAAIVTIGCGQHHCVKLFNPNVHRCGTIYALALRDLVRQKAINRRVIDQLEEINRPILEQVGRPGKMFELGNLEEIDHELKKIAKKGKES